MSRLDDAVRYIAREISPSRQDFLRDHVPGGAMLWTAMETSGLVTVKSERMALNEAGIRRLDAMEDQARALHEQQGRE